MQFDNHIVQYPKEHSLCTGCMSCETNCALAHFGIASPNRTCIHLRVGSTKTMIHTIEVCLQCKEHPCYEACPLKDEAMCIDENGIVYVNREKCIGCGKCERSCTQTPARVRVVKKDGKRFALKCDLCRDRAEGPICVAQCPAKVLGQSALSNAECTRPAGWVEEVENASVTMGGIPAAKKKG